MLNDILLELRNKGAKTLDWQEYKFDSQYEDGAKFLVSAEPKSANVIKPDDRICDSKLDFILSIRNLKRMYGDDCCVYIAKCIDFKTRGSAVITLDDLVIDNESDLNTEQKYKLEEYTRLAKSYKKDKGVSLQWGIDTEDNLVIEGVR